MNLITDLQGASHGIRHRVPEDIVKIQTYGEARGGYSNSSFPFMGMRRFVLDYLKNPITQADVDQGKKECPDFDEKMWQVIVDDYDGFLPIKIVGKKEGKLCFPGEVLWTIESLDPRCAMLPHMLDKLVVSYTWFDSTICQKLTDIRELIQDYCSSAGLPRKVAEQLVGGSTQFGHESLSVVVNSFIHLYFPQAVDHNVARHLDRYYGEKASGSRSRISDHSTILMWDSEEDCFDSLLERHGEQWFSMLIDSKDYVQFVDQIVPNFKHEILSREYALSLAIDTSSHFEALTYMLMSLSKTFGINFEGRGYKTLDAPIILAQIEEMSIDELRETIEALITSRWSPINFYWHISDHYFQEGLSRSTNGFVSKICFMERGDGVTKDISKNSIWDLGKSTKSGWQDLKDEHVYYEAGDISLDSIIKLRERLTS